MATPTLDCACHVQISAVGIVYELEPLRTLRSTTVIGKNKVVLEVRRSWRISQSETFPGEGIRSWITCTRLIHGWAASLIRESACKAQRAEECSTVKVGCFLRRTARCVALRKVPYCVLQHTVCTIPVGIPRIFMGERGIAGRLRLAGQSRCDSVRW